MRKLALLFVCCCATPTQAALLLYDGFAPNAVPTGPYNYQPNEPLAASPDPNGVQSNGQYNSSSTFTDKYWRYAGGGGASNNTPKIASGSLTYPGLMPSTGNKVSFDQTQIAFSRIQVANAISSG